MGVMLMGLAVTATSGMFLAAKRQMKMQQRQIETTQAARAAVDMIVRDLRLSGACLPRDRRLHRARRQSTRIRPTRSSPAPG